MYSYRSMTRRLKELPLWQKIAIVILSMAFVRVGSNIPLPFVNRLYIQSLLNVDGLGFFNSITGGSMLQMSFFALSVSPYITASIIIQLLTVVFPALEEMRKDGKTGMDRYKRLINITGGVLGILQAVSMAIGLGGRGLLDPYNWKTVLAATLIWSVGGIFIIFLGEFLEKLEIGSGISMILFCNIVSSIPSDLTGIWEYASVKNRTGMIVTCIATAVLAVAVLTICVVCQETVKKLQVVQTRKTVAGSDSTFPIPLLTCSVMPVIFAGSMMSFPILVAQFVPKLQEGLIGRVIRALNTSMWFRPDMPKYTVGAALYLILTILFTYFYLDIGFNPVEIADNLKKQGGVIPGIRPGRPTADYIGRLSRKVAMRGNLIMVAVVLASYGICNAAGIGSVSIAGTSSFICANVALEEYKKVRAGLALRSMGRKNFLIPAGLAKMYR